MKIETKLVPESTIEEFADTHNLTMQVTERSEQYVAMPHIGTGGRFYAHFRHAEIRSGERGLAAVYGNGAAAAEAIANYGPEISEKLLIVDAMTPERREIRVPRIVVKP